MTTEPTMTEEEVRDRFSDALEGELAPDARALFEAALRASPALLAEFEAFRSAVEATRRLADPGPSPTAGGSSPPSLLAGVQRKLRRRSRGRYYRDVFAERAGQREMLLTVVLALLVLAVVLGVAFVLPWPVP